jgi:hypothetical protein
MKTSINYGSATDKDCLSIQQVTHLNYWLDSDERSSATHYCLDGTGTGKIGVPAHLAASFSELIFKDYVQKRMYSLVQRRPADVANLVLDLDFGDRPLTRQQSEDFSWWVGQVVFAHTKGSTNKAAIFLNCDVGANVHLAFPYTQTTQVEAIYLMCCLPKMAYTDRKRFAGLENVTMDELRKIFDPSVVMCNGMRMPGSYKPKDKGLGPADATRVYYPRKMFTYDSARRIEVSAGRWNIFKACLLDASSPTDPVATVDRDTTHLFLEAKRFSEAKEALHNSEEKAGALRLPPATFLGKSNLMLLQRALQKLGYPKAPTIKEVQLPIGCKDPSRAGPQENPVTTLVLTFSGGTADGRWCGNKGGFHRGVSSYCEYDVVSGELSQRCYCNCPAGEKSVACYRYRSKSVVVHLDLPWALGIPAPSHSTTGQTQTSVLDVACNASVVVVGAAVTPAPPKKRVRPAVMASRYGGRKPWMVAPEHKRHNRGALVQFIADRIDKKCVQDDIGALDADVVQAFLYPCSYGYELRAHFPPNHAEAATCSFSSQLLMNFRMTKSVWSVSATEEVHEALREPEYDEQVARAAAGDDDNAQWDSPN